MKKLVAKYRAGAETAGVEEKKLPQIGVENQEDRRTELRETSQALKEQFAAEVRAGKKLVEQHQARLEAVKAAWKEVNQVLTHATKMGVDEPDPST